MAAAGESRGLGRRGEGGQLTRLRSERGERTAGREAPRRSAARDPSGGGREAEGGRWRGGGGGGVGKEGGKGGRDGDGESLGVAGQLASCGRRGRGR